MAGHNEDRPIIVKKRKIVGGDGHHGGAWKVAYADFVTAMMAFFMLMWLLNATTEQQRKGLADYFSPSIPIARTSGGSDGAFGGEDVFSENTIAQDGSGASDDRPTEGRQSMGLAGTEHTDREAQAEAAALQALGQAISDLGGDSMVSEIALRHVQTRLTDEGLVIEIYSRPEARIFDEDDQAIAWLPDLTAVVAAIIATVTNEVAVNAHVSAQPVVRQDADPWATTMARAELVRQMLVGGGLDPNRMDRLTGHADRRPATDDPTSPRNERIEIILLRQHL